MNIPSYDKISRQLCHHWQLGNLRGSLPVHRNWSVPIMLEDREVPLQGASTLFLIHPYINGAITANASKAYATDIPVGHSIHLLNGQVSPAQPLWRSRKKLVKIEVAKQPSVKDVADRLGYRVVKGDTNFEGRLITLPELEAPYILQSVTYLEWSRRGGLGYVGAEMALGLIASTLGVDLRGVEMTDALRSELASMPVNQFKKSIVEALSIASDILDDAGAEVQTYQESFFPMESSKASSENRIDLLEEL